MKQTTDLSKPPTCRDTRLFSRPVRAYPYDLPPGLGLVDLWSVDLSSLGLAPSDPDTAAEIYEKVAYPWKAAYSGGGRTFVFLAITDHHFHLVPYPFEPAPYEAGDRVFRPSSQGAGMLLRCGVVTPPHPGDYRGDDNFQRERVTVQWDGESQTSPEHTQYLELDHGGPRSSSSSHRMRPRARPSPRP